MIWNEYNEDRIFKKFIKHYNQSFFLKKILFVGRFFKYIFA